tara:strand:- start:787 stop:1374 length:588 start_codon:yes stop_codon:yes gene_type:complete
MAGSSRSINRIGITDLPEAENIKQADYLILQSDGISSTIQVKNIQLNRNNLSFYNEIVDLNVMTANHELSIENFSTSISHLSAEVDNVSTDVKNIKQWKDNDSTFIGNLSDGLSIDKGQKTINVGTAWKFNVNAQPVGDTIEDIKSMSTKLENRIKEIESLKSEVTELEARIKDLEDHIHFIASGSDHTKAPSSH